MEHRAAKSRKKTIDEWDALGVIDRTEMMAFDAAEAKVEAWEQQVAEKERK